MARRYCEVARRRHSSATKRGRHHPAMGGKRARVHQREHCQRSQPQTLHFAWPNQPCGLQDGWHTNWALALTWIKPHRAIGDWGNSIEKTGSTPVWEGGRLVAGSNDESGRVCNSQDVTPRETNSPRSAKILIGTSYCAEREGNRAMTQQRLNLQGMPPEPETDSRLPAGSANHEVSSTITLPPGI